VFRSCRYVLTGFLAALAVQAAPVVQAQGLEITPIGIDLADDGDNLVQASFAAAGNAPLIEGVQLGATPVAARIGAGLPQPSIIVGIIEAGREDEFGLATLLPATVEKFGFSLEDLEAREALRESNPDLLRRLVEEGYLDPDEDRLPRVLQTELARMNCNRSGIDGVWGRGSRGSVREYFAQLASVSWPDQAPTPELLRAIIINGDVACPTPAAVARPAPTPTPRRATTPTRTQPRAAAPVPKPVAPAAKPKPKLSIGGSGVLR